MVVSAASAQVGTAVDQSARATSERSKEAGDEVRGSMSSQPHRSIDKSKARMHKARARHHAHVAKKAARDATP
jgi:hypothetical protein